jgi:2-polyprenyl-3-methyl-5-hydroxy-6-metoxy-1,4-benzoquinol methylase
VTNALDELYEGRFSDREIAAKFEIWREIVAYLSRWIDPNEAVLDIACDRGYFSRWVHASERWASDVRDMRGSLPADVRFVHASGLELESKVGGQRFGTIFMSNYLEHLFSRDVVVEQLRVAARLLRPGGHVIVLQPNIRFVGHRYWDFIDHHVALTDHSLVEAAELASLRTVSLIPRFLPYTTKGRLPSNAALLSAYLSFPPAWRLLGRQTLYVGTT